jgi:hypothetical protein
MRSVAAAGVVLAVGAGIFGLSKLPSVSDPTEGGKVVELVNDLGRPVHFSLCEDQLCHTVAAGGATIPENKSFNQDVQPYSVTPFQLEIPPGDTGKCEILRVGASVMAQYRMSLLTPCDQG